MDLLSAVVTLFLVMDAEYLLRFLSLEQQAVSTA
jgi:hypothetical protein